MSSFVTAEVERNTHWDSALSVSLPMRDRDTEAARFENKPSKNVRFLSIFAQILYIKNKQRD